MRNTTIAARLGLGRGLGRGLGLGLGLGGLALAGCAAEGGYRTRADLVSDPLACADKRFEVYFVPDQATLTDAARQALGLTASQVQGCQVRHVKVLGLADARGGAAANQTLSERRARAVAEALAGAGLPAPAFEIEAAGDRGAMVDGVADPLRRRTEVLIEVAGPR